MIEEQEPKVCVFLSIRNTEGFTKCIQGDCEFYTTIALKFSNEGSVEIKGCVLKKES